jgi:proteic killer suppression protein
VQNAVDKLILKLSFRRKILPHSCGHFDLTHNVMRYRVGSEVIRSFKCRETQGIFELRRSRRLPGDIQQVALRKLRMLNRSQSIDDLKIPPANRLEKLSADRAGSWSIRINDQWRVCFRWDDGDAFEVEIVDYH